jgi:hypothetical protein
MAYIVYPLLVFLIPRYQQPLPIHNAWVGVSTKRHIVSDSTFFPQLQQRKKRNKTILRLMWL